MSKQPLGKGLSALIDTTEDINDTKVQSNNLSAQQEIPIAKMRVSNIQPRTHFEQDSLQELAESIKKNGLLQPIIIRLGKDDTYEIIAGERRFRAAKLAGLQVVPVIIKEVNDKQALEIALLENIQRENLTPIEEAAGYKRLQEEFNYTQEQLSGALGKSRSHIANMLRLLNLPQAVKDMLNKGLLTMGHARVLVTVPDPQAIAEKIVQENMSVRDTERYAAGSGTKSRKNVNSRNASADKITKDEDLQELERALSESTGLKVKIEDSKEGGRVILYFNNLTELDKILQKIG